MDKIKSNKNIKKKILKGIMWGIITLIYIPISLSYLSNQPLFQTFSARMATMILSDLSGYPLSINSINISLLDGIQAGGLSVYDKHENVMLKIGKLKVKPIYADWNIFGIMLHEVKIDSLDFRLGSYKNEKTLNFINFINSFSSDTTKSKTKSVFKLKVNNLEISNSHFELFNKSDTTENPYALDYSNMNYSDINFNVSNFKLYNDSLNFLINNFSAREKSGLIVKKLSTHLILSSTTITTTNLKAELNNSYLDGDAKLVYKNWGSMSYFNDSVQLYGNFKPSKIYLSDIGYFADVMFPMKNLIKLKGKIKGTVNNIDSKNLTFSFGHNTTFNGNIEIKNITDFERTKFKIDIKKLYINPYDITNFHLPDSSLIKIPENILTNENYTLTGTFNGNYFDFNTNLEIETGKSLLKAIVSFYYKKNDTVYFASRLNGNIVNAGQYLNISNYLGNSNFNVTAKGKGKTFDDLLINTGVSLKNTKILNYNYDSISFSGIFHKNKLQGNLTVLDSNLVLFSFINLGFTENPHYILTGDFRKAHLKDINLINSDFSFAAKTKVKIRGNDLNTLKADIEIDSATLAFANEHYNLNQLKLNKYDSAGQNIIKLHSDYIDSYISGRYSLTHLYENSEDLLNHYFKFKEKSQKEITINENIDICATIKNDKLISDRFLNGTRISPGSKLNASLNFKNDSVKAAFHSNLIKSSGIRLRNNLLNINTRNDVLLANFDSDNLILKDSTKDDPTKIDMENLKIKTSIAKSVLGFLINWNNSSDTLVRNSGKIQGYLFKNNDISTLSFDDISIYTHDSLWTINKNNKIISDKSGIHFNNFIIYGGESSLKIEGEIPKVNNDSLVVSFNKWNIAIINPLLRNTGYSINGFLNGTIETSKSDSNLAIVSDIKIKDFGFNKVYLGDLRLINTWDNINKSVFVKSQIIKKGKAGTGEIFSMEGFFYPFKKENSISINSKFSRLNIAFMNPILKDLFHNIKGKAKGSLVINGTPDAPVIKGKVMLNRTSLIINYLNTKYSFSNFLTFSKNKINFDDILIYDTLGNHAQISGNITHKFFNDFSYDFHIKTDKFLFVNTNRKQNELYYGTAIASGNIHMWGDPDKLHLNIETKTSRGTNLSIPLDMAYSTSDNEYIKFVPPPADSLTMKKKKEKEFEKNINESEMLYDIKVKANVTPDSRVNIYLPSDLGKIESRGHGTLNLNASSEGEFTMIGDYIIDRGNYNFNFKNLINKRFSLEKGGKITWTGDPTDAYINISAVYRVKTSLSSLGIVIDSTADYKNKQTVNCYIKLKNKLLNPDITFSIDLPDADPDIKRLVFTNLDTTNPAMVNEQMISLLVFGSFSFNNATNLSAASQGYNIITNQLSSMLSRISNNVDIGMNYRPGDDLSQQEFEVALSTQLFNDRLIIDGNVGMTYDKAQNNASNIVGDVDILYKLTKDGRWLLKAYNHSNANSWYYYNNYDKVSPYTQGVGIAYRKEFDNISELLKKRKKKRNKPKT